MVKINLKELDRDIFIRGNDAAARTVTIGRTDTFNDIVVVDSAGWTVDASGNTAIGGTLGVTGAATLASLGVTGTSTFTGGVTLGTVTAPATANSEVFGASAGNPGGISGTHNTIFGASAGAALTTGASNTLIGFEAGAAAVGLSTTTLIGRGAGAALVTGVASTAIGYNAMSVATNDGMTAIGSSAMANSNGDNNLAVGSNALLGSAVTEHTGQFNVAIGAEALKAIEGNTWNNTAIGGNSCAALTTGIGNTCIGKDSGKALTTGGSNIFIGNATGDTTTTGGSNILIGSGLDTTGATTTGELRIHYAGGSNIPIISADMVSGKMGVNIVPGSIDATLHVLTDASDAIDCLRLEQLDVSENFLALESTSAASVVNPLTSWTSGNSIQGFFRVDINGTARWVPFYDAPTS